jgi:hypothetical protein
LGDIVNEKLQEFFSPSFGRLQFCVAILARQGENYGARRTIGVSAELLTRARGVMSPPALFGLCAIA